MLKSYKAIYDNGQLKWLEDTLKVISARVIITILEESNKSVLALHHCGMISKSLP